MSGADALEPENLAGYAIHATDGEVGKVDRDDMSTGARYLLVDTGRWLFARSVLLPASVIESIDHRRQAVQLTCNRETIKGAPEYRDDHAHRADLDAWYGKPMGLYGSAP
jgi:hypothetical protein